MEKRSKKLLMDVAMFALSNFGSKVLVFLMVPLYTHVLSTEEYGIADLLSGTINILLPMLTLAITEATLRFLLDENADNGKVLGASLLFIGASFALLAAVTPVAKSLNADMGAYWGYFLAMYLATALHSCFSNYVRGVDKTRLFAMKGVLHTALLVSLNLLFLLGMRMGIEGYLLAIIVSDILVILFMAVGCKLWLVIPSLRLDLDMVRQMLRYSVPMIPTIIAWWVMQMSDKYILIAFSGLAVSGIYAIAYRIPSVLSIVSSIFNQAWQIAAVKSMRDADYKQYVKQVYNYFFAVSVGLCSVLIAGAQMIGGFMFQNDYYIAWTYVPVLLVAYFLSALSGVMASVFTTMKRTTILLYSTVCGAVLNVVLNLLFIPEYGAMAAAATTASGFFATFIIRSICTQRFFDIRLNGAREFALVILLSVQAVIMSMDVVWKMPVQIVCLAVFAAVYRKEIMGCLRGAVTQVRKVLGGNNR